MEPRSADFQSAVSRISNLQALRSSQALPTGSRRPLVKCRRTALSGADRTPQLLDFTLCNQTQAAKLHSMKARMAIVGLLLVIIFALGIGLGIMFTTWMRSSSRFSNTPALLLQVKTLSDLVTVQYVIENVVILKDVKGIAGCA